jgi:hypothetical protein
VPSFRRILVGGFKHVLFFHIIWDVILPIDELIFSRWLLHHQPVIICPEVPSPLHDFYVMFEFQVIGKKLWLASRKPQAMVTLGMVKGCEVLECSLSGYHMES